MKWPPASGTSRAITRSPISKALTRNTSRFRSKAANLASHFVAPASRRLSGGHPFDFAQGRLCPPIRAVATKFFESQQSEQLSAGLIISVSLASTTPPGPTAPARTGRSAMLAAQDRIEVQHQLLCPSAAGARRNRPAVPAGQARVPLRTADSRKAPHRFLRGAPGSVRLELAARAGSGADQFPFGIRQPVCLWH